MSTERELTGSGLSLGSPEDQQGLDRQLAADDAVTEGTLVLGADVQGPISMPAFNPINASAVNQADDTAVSQPTVNKAAKKKTKTTPSKKGKEKERQNCNSDEGGTQIGSPTESDYGRGVHLVQLYDEENPYESGVEPPSDVDEHIEDAMKHYRGRNIARFGHPGDKAAEQYKQRMLLSKAKSLSLTTRKTNTEKANEAFNESLKRAAERAPSDTPPGTPPDTPPGLTPSERKSFKCSKAGKVSQKVQAERREAKAAGLPVPPLKSTPKKKRAKADKGAATPVKLIPIPSAGVLNTADTTPIVSKAQDTIKAAIDAAVQDVVRTKDEEIKEAWAQGYEKGWKDGEATGWNTCKDEVKRFCNNMI